MWFIGQSILAYIIKESTDDLGYDFEQRYVKFNRNNLL